MKFWSHFNNLILKLLKCDLNEKPKFKTKKDNIKVEKNGKQSEIDMLRILNKSSQYELHYCDLDYEL